MPPPPKTPPHLVKALRQARELNDDLCTRLVITTLLAHFRGGEISLPDAAKACSLSEDDFRRAGAILDNEARAMIARKADYFREGPEPPQEGLPG